MPSVWLEILAKTSAGLIVKKLLSLPSNWFARRKASGRSTRGEDLASQSSLHHLIKTELERLATSNNLPQQLQSDQCRNWLLQNDNVGLFIEVMIARAGGHPDMSKQAEEQLALKYERETGETRKLASGRVSYAVSYVYGQFNATEHGKDAFLLALTQWTAVHSLEHRLFKHQLPSDADLDRMKAMAETLLEAGKRSWKMPRFVAPLTLKTHEQKSDRELHPTNVSELLSAIGAGDNLILYGSGGIGKTTFMLDLCALCLKHGSRIPIFIDVTGWARANKNLFEYIASLPSAQKFSITSVELTKLAEACRLAIMLNGWNEISASLKLGCLEGLLQIQAVAKALNVVVTSRSSNDVPNLTGVKKIEVQGLDWQGQSTVIRAELDNHRALPLLDLLAKNTRLRHAARSPLILRGLIAQTRKDQAAYSSEFDLLGAAVDAFEEDDQHSLMLSSTPVDGHQHVYLEELACLLTQRLATTCSREEAIQAIHSAVTRLIELNLIGSLPNLSSVLDILINHHLLHLDDNGVRFAHHRFQEYFTAKRLLGECLKNGAPPALLRTAINQPIWDDSLMLVAGKLKGEEITATVRVRLVKTAAEIDLGIACDLAGICTFSQADDPDLHQYIVTRVNQLAASPVEELQNLGIAYQIASGLEAFAEKLWPLFENENRNIRLTTNRINGSAISLAQFGAGAKQRINSWPLERRVEFLHEISDNADNYDFLLSVAQDEPEPIVRAAAISSLLWDFPASEAPLRALLDAPFEVLMNHNIINSIKHAFVEGTSLDALRERLLTMPTDDMPSSALLQMVLAFPDEFGPRCQDVIFEHLATNASPQNSTALLAIAQSHDPQRLVSLAKELVFQPQERPKEMILRYQPDSWVGQYLCEATEEVKTDIFERAWNNLQGSDFNDLNDKILGPLANYDQIERVVIYWMQYSKRTNLVTFHDIDHERAKKIESILKHTIRDDLLDVVIQLGQSASYHESTLLLDLVLQRIGYDEESDRSASIELPNLERTRELVKLFSDLVEPADIPQDTVRVHLCNIASRVAPREFKSLLMETCHRHLNAFSLWREKIDQWSKSPTGPRPHNPQWGHYLSRALARLGHDALPGLLDFMDHPCSMEFIPLIIVKIINVPSIDPKARILTKDTAKVLGQKLTELVTICLQEKSSDQKWNARKAGYQIGHLAGIVANIRSDIVIEPLEQALSAGLMNVAETITPLRRLLQKNKYMLDRGVIRQLEELYEKVAMEKWPDAFSRHAISQFIELLLCIEPTLLTKTTEYYLQQWRRFLYPQEIVQRLASVLSEVAWPALLKMAKEFTEKGQQSDELISALLSALTSQRLPEFFALLADGTFFSWCHYERGLIEEAPKVVALILETGQVEAFLEACQKAKSSLADALAGEVLSYIEGSEMLRQSYLLKALDTGRAVDSNKSAYRMLIAMFQNKTPISDTQYEVAPKASNEIRKQIYIRAKGVGPVADSCKRLLSFLECERREMGRPDDESRHPYPAEGEAWTNIFLTGVN